MFHRVKDKDLYLHFFKPVLYFSITFVLLIRDVEAFVLLVVEHPAAESFAKSSESSEHSGREANNKL